MVFAGLCGFSVPFGLNRLVAVILGLVELLANCENAIYGKTHFRDRRRG